MEAYSIYRQDKMEFQWDRAYVLNYSKAVIRFNDLLRKSIKDVYDTIEKEDFSEVVSSFKKWEMGKRLDGSKIDIEIICRKCPFILYKKNNKLIERVYSWEEPCNYMEQDIIEEEVVLEKIELLE